MIVNLYPNAKVPEPAKFLEQCKRDWLFKSNKVRDADIENFAKLFGVRQNIAYEFMLEGYGAEWIQCSIDIHSYDDIYQLNPGDIVYYVHYNSIGEYVFQCELDAHESNVITPDFKKETILATRCLYVHKRTAQSIFEKSTEYEIATGLQRLEYEKYKLEQMRTKND